MYRSTIANTRTGNEPTTISTLTRPVQVNTGIRISAIPGALRRATVATTHPAIRVIPTAARITPSTHRSWPTPGVLVPFESGTYENQPARPGPVPVNQPVCITPPPHSQIQNPHSATRGPAIPAAPI